MATKTLYVLNTAPAGPGFFQNMQDGGSVPTATPSNTTFFPGNAAITTPYYALQASTSAGQNTSGTASSVIDARSAPAKGTTSTLGGDSCIAGPFSGTFALTAWTLNWTMRAVTAGATGRMRTRIWKGSNADGTGATLLSASTQIGATVGPLTTTASSNSSISWTPAAAIVCNNEYLFFQCEWQETTAGTSTGSDVTFYVSTALIITSDFAPAAVIPKATLMMMGV